jgi:hypothetical protein
MSSSGLPDSTAGRRHKPTQHVLLGPRWHSCSAPASMHMWFQKSYTYNTSSANKVQYIDTSPKLFFKSDLTVIGYANTHVHVCVNVDLTWTWWNRTLMVKGKNLLLVWKRDSGFHGFFFKYTFTWLRLAVWTEKIDTTIFVIKILVVSYIPNHGGLDILWKK